MKKKNQEKIISLGQTDADFIFYFSTKLKKINISGQPKTLCLRQNKMFHFICALFKTYFLLSFSFFLNLGTIFKYKLPPISRKEKFKN